MISENIFYCTPDRWKWTSLPMSFIHQSKPLTNNPCCFIYCDFYILFFLWELRAVYGGMRIFHFWSLQQQCFEVCWKERNWQKPFPELQMAEFESHFLQPHLTPSSLSYTDASNKSASKKHGYSSPNILMRKLSGRKKEKEKIHTKLCKPIICQWHQIDHLVISLGSYLQAFEAGVWRMASISSFLFIYSCSCTLPWWLQGRKKMYL